MNKLMGRKIHILRSQSGKSVDEMARLLNITREQYIRIEKGMANINLDLVYRIAGILDVPETDILLAEDSYPNLSVGFITEMVDLFYANKHLYEKLQ